MHEERPRRWYLADARFWCVVYTVLFWPAVLLFHVAGCLVLTVAVFGAWFALQPRAARARREVDDT